MTVHLLERIRDYAKRLRDGELDKIWFDMTGSRFPYAEKREIAKFLARLADLLRRQEAAGSGQIEGAV